MEIKGKHVLITGAAIRIGEALAKTFLEHNALVTAHYHRSTKEINAWATTHSKRENLFTYSADLRDLSQIEQLIEKSIKHFGLIDILINSASVFMPSKIETIGKHDWESHLEPNLLAPFYLCQKTVEGMKVKKEGLMINIADVYGEKPLKNFTPYSVSKAALIHLTRNLAKEYAPFVRVNAISPGPILPPNHYSSEQIDKAAQRTLFHRWGTPLDIVHAAFFLTQNDYLTGVNLKVDGGRSVGFFS